MTPNPHPQNAQFIVVVRVDPRTIRAIYERTEEDRLPMKAAAAQIRLAINSAMDKKLQAGKLIKSLAFAMRVEKPLQALDRVGTLAQFATDDFLLDEHDVLMLDAWDKGTAQGPIRVGLIDFSNLYGVQWPPVEASEPAPPAKPKPCDEIGGKCQWEVDPGGGQTCTKCGDNIPF